MKLIYFKNLWCSECKSYKDFILDKYDEEHIILKCSVCEKLTKYNRDRPAIDKNSPWW